MEKLLSGLTISVVRFTRYSGLCLNINFFFFFFKVKEYFMNKRLVHMVEHSLKRYNRSLNIKSSRMN